MSDCMKCESVQKIYNTEFVWVVYHFGRPSDVWTSRGTAQLQCKNNGGKEKHWTFKKQRRQGTGAEMYETVRYAEIWK